MPQIQLYELGPTRSSRVRWVLLEADIPYKSLGNEPAILGSEALRRVHPLGKLPAALIDGEPLFESAAIATAVADRVPEKGLIAPAGTRARALHDQWVSFALTEMEAWAWLAELNDSPHGLPIEEQVPAVVAQARAMYRRGAAVLDAELSTQDYLVDDRFSVTDMIVGYTLVFGEEFGWLDGFSHLNRYLERLRARPLCTLPTF